MVDPLFAEYLRGALLQLNYSGSLLNKTCPEEDRKSIFARYIILADRMPGNAVLRSEFHDIALGLPYIFIDGQVTSTGYFNSAICEIELGDIITSYVYFWKLQLYERSESDLIVILYRVSLYHLSKEGGFRHAVRFLFDVLAAGFILENRPIEKVLIMLMELEERFKTGEATLVHLFGGLPIEQKTYFQSRLNKIKTVEAQHRSYIPDMVIALTQQKIEEVKKANDFDCWILGKQVIGGLTRLSESLLRGLNLAATPLIKIILDQWEELAADEFADKISMMRARFPYLPDYDYGVKMARMVEKTFPVNGLEKFLQERMLLPKKIAERLMNDLSDIPFEWQRMRIVTPCLNYILSKRTALSLHRISSFSLEEIAEIDLLTELKKHYDIPTQLLSILYLTIPVDRLGWLEEEYLKKIIEVVCFATEQGSISNHDEDYVTLLRERVSSMKSEAISNDDYYTDLLTLASNHQLNNARERLRGMVDIKQRILFTEEISSKYPYNADFQIILSDAYLQSNQFLMARKHLYNALLLDPFYKNEWECEWRLRKLASQE